MLIWLGWRTRLSGTTRLRLSTPMGDLKVEKVLIFKKIPVVYGIVSIVWKNHGDRTTLSIKFPIPQDTLSAPNSDMLAPSLWFDLIFMVYLETCRIKTGWLQRIHLFNKKASATKQSAVRFCSVTTFRSAIYTNATKSFILHILRIWFLFLVLSNLWNLIF